MIGLPEIGDEVEVWPTPGRKVQDGERTLDAGGRFLAPGGRVVLWTQYRLEQYRAGDLLLIAPPKEDEAAAAKPRAKFDPTAAAKAQLKADAEKPKAVAPKGKE